MAKLPTYEEMGKKIAEEALDRYIYKGKTLREWVDILAQTQWIPVSEKKPESEGYGHYFLCCLENGIIRILGYSNILTTRCPKGFYYEKENGTTWRQDINPVIAWMPLPERYKDGE